ncbi:MAG: hypothetical protein WC761_06985 [Candidatus Paceibacterota bacterium]|jgi:site-specific recombinase XerD
MGKTNWSALWQKMCDTPPYLVNLAGEKSVIEFREFIEGVSEDDSSRYAHARAITEFSDWCEKHGFALRNLSQENLQSYARSLRRRHPAHENRSRMVRLSKYFTHLKSAGLLRDDLVPKSFRPTHTKRKQSLKSRVVSNGELPPTVIASGEQVVTSFKRYLEIDYAALARNSQEIHDKALDSFLAWCNTKGIRLIDVGPYHMISYRDHLMEQHNANPARIRLGAVRKLFSRLVTDNLLESNPAHAAVIGRDLGTCLIPSLDLPESVPELIKKHGDESIRVYCDFFTQVDCVGSKRVLTFRLTRFFTWCAGRIEDVFAATTKDLVRFQNALKKQYKNSTVDGIISSLVKLYDHFQKHGQVQRNPALQLERIKEKQTILITPASQVDVAKLFDYLANDSLVVTRDRAIVSCVFFAFAKFDDLVNLNLGDLECETQGSWLHLGKNREIRRVPIVQDLLADLNNYIDVADIANDPKDSPLFRPLSTKDHKVLTRKPLSIKHIRTLIRERSLDAGIADPAINFTSLRAAGIEAYFASGGDLLKACALTRLTVDALVRYCCDDSDTEIYSGDLDGLNIVLDDTLSESLADFIKSGKVFELSFIPD